MKKKLLTIAIFFAITANSQVKIKSSTTQIYNSFIGWLTGSGYDYEYDEEGKLISKTLFIWNVVNSEWITDRQFIYTYNNDDNIEEQLIQYWDDQGEKLNHTKILYSYNNDKLLREILIQLWTEDQWVNYKQTTTEYDDNLVSENINKDWINSEWVNLSRKTTNYVNNNVVEVINEAWQNSSWVKTSRDLFEYDNNYKSAHIIEFWQNDSWIENERTNYIFDNNMNRLSEINLKNGINNTKIEYTYDQSFELSNFYHPFNDLTGTDYFYTDFPYFNKILSAVTWSYNVLNNSFEQQRKTIYNYDNSILNVKEYNLRQPYMIHPNPSSNFIKIDGITNSENIRIYNILGKKVLEKKVSSNTEINIKELPQGLYIIQYQNGKISELIKK